jgi:hypothetical protein
VALVDWLEQAYPTIEATAEVMDSSGVTVR